jgi:hypothetical protein
MLRAAGVWDWGNAESDRIQTLSILQTSRRHQEQPNRRLDGVYS